MMTELSFFRLILLACLEAGVLAVPSFRDPVHATFFALLFGIALILQWLIHGEKSLRTADLSHLMEPAELERVFFAGNELETDVEVSAENSTLREALGVTHQLKIRLGMVLLFGLFLFWAFRTHASVQMLVLFPVLAALSIVPAMSLNHFMLPLAASAFGVLSGALGEAPPHSWQNVAFRALFVLSFTVAIWSYRRVEFSLRDTEEGNAPVADPRREWDLAAKAACVFMVIWLALDMLVPRFEPAPPKALSQDSKSLEHRVLEAAARHLMTPSHPGGGSFANSATKQTATRGTGSQAGSPLAGLNPGEIAAARALAQAVRSGQAGSGAGQRGSGNGQAASGNGQPASAAGQAGASAAQGSGDQEFPRTRAEAEQLLKQFSAAPVDRSEGDKAGTDQARSAGSSEATNPAIPMQAPRLPASDAELARTLSAARALLEQTSGAPSGMPALSPGSLQAQVTPAQSEPAATQADRAPDKNSEDDERSEAASRFGRRIELFLRMLFALAVLGFGLVFLQRLLLKPSSQDPARRRRVSRRERQAIGAELSRINHARMTASEEVRARYALFLRAASLRGLPKEDWLPPTDFGIRIGEDFPPVAENSHLVTDVFCESAYAERDPDTLRLETFRLACTQAIHGMLN